MKNLFISLFCLLSTLTISAQTFDYPYMGQKLTYEILDEINKTCMVKSGNQSSNQVIIPREAVYNGISYRVVSIGESAFAWHFNLKSVSIPNTVTTIGKLAFAESALGKVVIPNSVTTIGATAFATTFLQTVTIPNSVTEIGPCAFTHCSDLTEINVDSGNSAYCSVDGVLYNKDKTRLCAYPGAKEDESFEIPTSVTVIGNYAFTDGVNLTSIKIPETVTSIEHNAFENCSKLETIKIPNSITTIEDQTFYCCRRLFSVNIPSSVSYIGYLAFCRCSGLRSVFIPGSVTTIQADAFKICDNLSEIYYEAKEPVSVNEIAFSDYSKPTLYVRASAMDKIKELVPWYFFLNVKSYEFADLRINNSSITMDVGNRCTLPVTKEGRLSELTWTSSNTKVATVDSEGTVSALAFGNATITVSATDLLTGATISSSCNVGVKRPDKYTLNYQYDADNLTATVTSISVSEDLVNCIDVVVPEYVEQGGRRYTVTAIGDRAFYHCRALTSLTLPVSITSIGDHAVASCSFMTSVTMGDLVTSIGRSAFEFSYSIKSLRLSKSLKDIGEYAFSSSSIEKIYYGADDPVSASSGIFIGYTNTTLYVKASALDKIRSTMPWSLFEKIETYDFRDITLDNTSLSMRPGESLTLNVINNSGMTDLKWISTNPEVATVDGNGRVTTHAGGTAKIIVTATDPKNNTTVGAFCNITVIVLNYTYDQSSLTATVTGISDIKNGDPVDIVIPEYVEHEGQQYKVTAIGDNAFNRCDKLNSVTISNTVISIGRWAFEYCTGLTSVSIGNSVTTLNSRAFSGCSNLTLLTLPNSVTTINMGAFEFCSSLTSVTLGDSLNYLGNRAFYKCTGLKSVNIPNSVEIIGPSAFSGCENLTSVTIPGSVNIIGTDAFKDCKSLTSVTLPNSVTEIMSFTFMNCSSLVSVDLGDSVSSIGSVAFYGCSSLSTITIQIGRAHV